MSFKKGAEWNGNKNGRPKGARDRFTLDILCKEIKKYEKENEVNFYKHVIEQAFVNTKVLVVLLHKLLPNVVIEEQIDPALEEELQLITLEQENSMKNRLGKYLSTGDNGKNNKGDNGGDNDSGS